MNKPKLTNFDDYLVEKLKDQKIKNEYDALEPEFALLTKILDRRYKLKLTQRELAKRLGTTQSVIARLESGRANPSYKFLHRLATALDSKLQINFLN